MTFFPNFRTFVQIGSFSLGWYPILLTSGAILVYKLSEVNTLKNGYSKDMTDDLFIYGTIGGVIGARLWYVIFYDLKMYLSDPISIFKTWEGGLAIQGTIVGAALAIFLYCRKHHYDIFRVLDCIFPNVLIGQALGRWGNFFNQEAFGRVVDASYYNGWPSFIADHMYIGGAYREPTFLYESVLNLAGFLFINLWFKKKRNNRRGDLIYIYLIWYGIDRIIVETFRSDSLMLGPLKMAQVTSVVFLIIGFSGLKGYIRKWVCRRPVILFDFDQTIINSEPIISETFRQMFEKYLPEHGFSEEDAKNVLGPTLQESFERYHFPEETDKLVAEYRAINRALHTPEHLKAMPHAEELLKSLKAQGYKTGIVSNKMNATVKLGLQVIGLSQYFDCIVGSDEVENVKPNPEGIHKATVLLDGSYDNCIYVGDVKGDIETGRNAMAYTIGYNTDKDAAERLLEAGANTVVTDLSDILEVLKGDHEWTKNLT